MPVSLPYHFSSPAFYHKLLDGELIRLCDCHAHLEAATWGEIMRGLGSRLVPVKVSFYWKTAIQLQWRQNIQKDNILLIFLEKSRLLIAVLIIDTCTDWPCCVITCTFYQLLDTKCSSDFVQTDQKYCISVGTKYYAQITDEPLLKFLINNLIVFFNIFNHYVLVVLKLLMVLCKKKKICINIFWKMAISYGSNYVVQ